MTFWILSAIKRLPIDTGCLGFDRGRHVEGLICLSLAHYIQPKRISSCGRTAPPPHPTPGRVFTCAAVHACSHAGCSARVFLLFVCVFVHFRGKNNHTYGQHLWRVCVCVFLRLSGVLCLRHATSFEGDCCVWNNSS